ncbi:hypothetical protein K431DRAFT_311628 [Polychaeton citri CBS 116435]|uniref:Uncharacterized protein n=1 Tax=Polychaeton citri CBS 116435 TaxID=1314669 RepID=A0A9P4URJ3_9PEZI|nr:hypothetical protein K431DRAFT_311628 [Polychaeton citri CBS 116435]
MAQKLLANQAEDPREAPPSIDPPPYSANDDDGDSEDDEEDEESLTPVKLVVNAVQTIRGSNNILPMPTTVLADVTKLSQSLAIIMSDVDQAFQAVRGEASQRRRKALKLDLTVHCGVTVIGDRNVIGNVALRPKPSPSSVLSEGSQNVTTTGAKRPAEEDHEDTPSTKRVAPGSTPSGV